MTQPPYGQYPWYGQGAPYGQPPPPPPPPENKLLPWLIVGGAVLLSAMGILLVLLLRSDDRGSTSAAALSTSPTSSAPATSASASAHGELPGGARVADQDTAAGADPAWTLGTYFFEQTLSRHGFTEGSFDSIIYSQESGSDIASFTLQLDDGEDFLLLVYVASDGTVCDFI
jgi:hypothetical protein